MLNFKTAFLLAALLLCTSGALYAADSAPKPKHRPSLSCWWKAGCWEAISSSIDDVQQQLDLNQGLIDAWRLRADRAVDEVGRLVDQTSERSPWSVAGDFVLLSGVWVGAFALLTLLGRLIVQRFGATPMV